jgi:CIC family chloride channel protein
MRYSGPVNSPEERDANDVEGGAPPESPLSPSGTARFALGVVLVAFLATGFAVGFRSGLALLLDLSAQAPDIVHAMQRAPLWARVLVPAAGGLAAGLIGIIVKRSPQGHGVGDVMEAVVLGQVRLSMRTTLLKSLASFFAIATGGSLGREGPLIQFGGAAGKVVGKWLALSPGSTRRLIAAGTAAGFAAAYNTPFAAVLFVLEVVTGMFVLDVVVPALVATVVAAEITRLLLGEGPIYGHRTFVLNSASELFWFAGLGLLCALAAQGFMRLLTWGEQRFARVSLPWRPALGAALAGGMIAWMPEVSGNGYEPLNGVIDGRFSVTFVLLLIMAKCLATTASVSSGSPGGVFTPNLLLGGGIGYVYGTGLAALFGSAVGPAGGYALVGMAATTAASTHAPLMAAVMAFELSGNYAVVLPLSLATAVATAVSRALRKDSIYTAELHARGLGWELTLEGRRFAGAKPKE